MGVGNGRVLSESGTDVVFLEELVLVGEARLLVVPQPMELQWMLGWDGCDGKVLKKDSDFLGIVSEFNVSGMLDLICTWGSTFNFNTNF